MGEGCRYVKPGRKKKRKKTKKENNKSIKTKQTQKERQIMEEPLCGGSPLDVLALFSWCWPWFIEQVPPEAVRFLPPCLCAPLGLVLSKY